MGASSLAETLSAVIPALPRWRSCGHSCSSSDGSFHSSDEDPDTNCEPDADLENSGYYASNQGAFSDAGGISCRRSTREFRNEGPDERADECANDRPDDRNWKSDHRAHNASDDGTPSCTTRAAVFAGVAAGHRYIQ